MSNIENSTVQGWFSDMLRAIALLITKALLWSCFLTVVLFPFYRLWFWLKNGFLLKYSGFYALYNLEVHVQLERITWLGVQKLIVWFLEQPLEIGLFMLLLPLGFLLLELEKFEKR